MKAMVMNKKTAFIIILGCCVIISACAGQSKQTKGTVTGAGVGAAVGAGLGQAIGGDTEATLLGAAIGAAVGGIAGNQIGAYMDRQEQELKAALAASEAASIQREQNVLTATFKGDVFFEFDSAKLMPGAQREMDRVANVLIKYPQTKIRVEGHTDTVGPETYNQALSEKRANAVADALIQRNVGAHRITALGFGESQPISSNDTMNRRVNIVIIPVEAG